MSQAIIMSINVGKPRMIGDQSQEVLSGIDKQPMDVALYLSQLNFAGDGQGDLVHHGGKEKAVCVYPFEHYSYWEHVLHRKLNFGAFGENLTIAGMQEDNVCIGDICQLGQAIVQVSQPRQPCYKLSIKYQSADLPLMVQETGYTGFYMRVLQEGFVVKEEGLSRIERHPLGITVSYANQIMHREKDNVEGMKQILAVDALSENWRNTFLKRIAGNEIDIKQRLTGGFRDMS